MAYYDIKEINIKSNEAVELCVVLIVEVFLQKDHKANSKLNSKQQNG